MDVPGTPTIVLNNLFLFPLNTGRIHNGETSTITEFGVLTSFKGHGL